MTTDTSARHLCHLCQAELGDDYVRAGGLDWCGDGIECNFRARLRLGIGYANALRWKATDLHLAGYSAEQRAERFAATPPPVQDADYAAYMHSPEWESFANEQRVMARFRCEWCPATNVFKLDVHHLHYTTFGRERPEDVLVVCPLVCHPELDRVRRAGNRPPVVIRVESGPPPRRVVTRTDTNDAGDDRSAAA